MKNIKRIVAFVAVMALTLTCFAGCHKKNEVAVKVGDYKFTSGYYCCALVYADTEARAEVDKKLAAEGKSTENVKYLKQKIDGKTYEKWVKEKAKKNILLNAAYKLKCKELGVDLDETDISTADSYVNYYWNSYGYSELFGNNGVSKETFTEYTKDTYYQEKYFEKVYGKDGTNPIGEEELKSALSGHYILVNQLEATLSGTDEDAEADEKIRVKFEGYKNDLLKNPNRFKEFYDIENPSDEEDKTTSATTEESTEKTAKPLDSLASVLGDSDTNSSSDLYDEVKDLGIGDVTIVTTSTKLVLLVKKDILADPYYLTQYDTELRHLLKDEDVKKDFEKFTKELKAEFVASAVDRFKVKNIEYPEQQ